MTYSAVFVKQKIVFIQKERKKKHLSLAGTDNHVSHLTC